MTRIGYFCDACGDELDENAEYCPAHPESLVNTVEVKERSTPTWTLCSGLAPIRKQLKLTQKELAHELGVQTVTVWRWENGHALPELSTLFFLCDFLTTYSHKRGYDLDVAPTDIIPSLTHPGRVK